MEKKHRVQPVAFDHAKSSLEAIQREVGRVQDNKSANKSLIGEALLDVASYILSEEGDLGELENLRERWRSQIIDGERPPERHDADARYFQSDVEEVASLKEDGDSQVIYSPGSSGIVRLCVRIHGDEPRIHLIDAGSLTEVSERFNRISES